MQLPSNPVHVFTGATGPRGPDGPGFGPAEAKLIAEHGRKLGQSGNLARFDIFLENRLNFKHGKDALVYGLLESKAAHVTLDLKKTYINRYIDDITSLFWELKDIELIFYIMTNLNPIHYDKLGNDIVHSERVDLLEKFAELAQPKHLKSMLARAVNFSKFTFMKELSKYLTDRTDYLKCVVMMGDLDLVKKCHSDSKDSVFDYKCVMNNAARFGHHELIKWAMEDHNVPIDDKSIVNSLKYNHTKIIDYFFSSFNRYSKQHWKNILFNGSLDAVEKYFNIVDIDTETLIDSIMWCVDYFGGDEYENYIEHDTIVFLTAELKKRFTVLKNVADEFYVAHECDY
jgi:hypothetical protein